MLCTPCVDRRTGLAGGRAFKRNSGGEEGGGLVDKYRSLLRLFDIRGTGGCVKRGNSSRLGLMILMMALSRRGDLVGCSFHWNRIDPDSNNLCQIFMSLFHLIKRRQIILRSFVPRYRDKK